MSKSVKGERSASNSPSSPTRRDKGASKAALQNAADDKACDNVQIDGKVYLEIDLQKSASRTSSIAALIGRAEQAGNVIFEAHTGRAYVVRPMPFRKRAYSPCAAGDAPPEPVDLVPFQQVARDLATLCKGFPGECRVVRLFRPATQTQANSGALGREQWAESVANSQCEYFAKILAEVGVPAKDISVEIEYAGSNPPPGLFYLVVSMQEEDARVQRAMEREAAMVQAITKRRNVTFDLSCGICEFVRALPWMPRKYSPGSADPPTAELAKNQNLDDQLHDMAEVCLVFGAPARMLCKYPDDLRLGSPTSDQWMRTLGRNRAALVQQALENRGIPDGMLIAGMHDDPLPADRFQLQVGDSPSAEALTAHRSQAKVDRIRAMKNLEKAGCLTRIEDIPILEEALEVARGWRLDEQWTRVHPLLTDAEDQLQVLYQRRRRHQARSDFSDRNVALARVKVSSATQESMVKSGDMRKADVRRNGRGGSPKRQQE